MDRCSEPRFARPAHRSMVVAVRPDTGKLRRCTRMGSERRRCELLDSTGSVGAKND